MTTQPIAPDPYANLVFKDPAYDPRTWDPMERCLRLLWFERADYKRCKCMNPYHGYHEWKENWTRLNHGYSFSPVFYARAGAYEFPINPEGLRRPEEPLYTEQVTSRGTLPAHTLSGEELAAIQRGIQAIECMLPTITGQAKEDVLTLIRTLTKALPVIESEGICALATED